MPFLQFNELLVIGITYRDCNYINRKINSPYNLRLTSAKNDSFSSWLFHVKQQKNSLMNMSLTLMNIKYIYVLEEIDILHPILFAFKCQYCSIMLIVLAQYLLFPKYSMLSHKYIKGRVITLKQIQDTCWTLALISYCVSGIYFEPAAT